MCTPMFIAALFTIAKTWKQLKCPLTDEWIKKMWYIYTTEQDIFNDCHCGHVSHLRSARKGLRDVVGKRGGVRSKAGPQLTQVGGFIINTNLEFSFSGCY